MAKAVQHAGDFFGEMTFAATCHKILKGRADVEEDGADSLKRACDVVACGSTRCLELSVKDFLSVLKDDLVGSREAMRSISNMTPLISKRRQTVKSIQNGSFGVSETSGASSEDQANDDLESQEQGKEEPLRSHAGYAQDIIMADGSHEIMRRRLEKNKSASRDYRGLDLDSAFDKALDRQKGLLVPGRVKVDKGVGSLQRRRTGWSGKRNANSELEALTGSSFHSSFSRGSSHQGSASVSRASSRAPSRAASGHATPRSRSSEEDRESSSSRRVA